MQNFIITRHNSSLWRDTVVRRWASSLHPGSSPVDACCVIFPASIKRKKKKTTARHTKRLKNPESFIEHLKKVYKNMKEHNTKFKIYHIGEKSQFCLYQNHLTYNNFSSIEDKLENIGN